MARWNRQLSLWPKTQLRGLSQQFDPVHAAQTGATAYGFTSGQGTTELGNIQRDPAHGHATFLAYREAMGKPEAPGIRASYEAMRQHVNLQYEHMTRPKEQGGMGFTHEVTRHDPYETPQQMAKDVGQRRIKTWTSEPTPHAFFTAEENDRFRAVHDVFGHAATGRGFSRHGEEAAYLAHRRMFPQAAQAALASETRGQNSYLNYSPQGGFPDQGTKLIGLPEWVSSAERKLPEAPRRIRRQGERQLTLF